MESVFTAAARRSSRTLRSAVSSARVPASSLLSSITSFTRRRRSTSAGRTRTKTPRAPTTIPPRRARTTMRSTNARAPAGRSRNADATGHDGARTDPPATFARGHGRQAPRPSAEAARYPETRRSLPEPSSAHVRPGCGDCARGRRGSRLPRRVRRGWPEPGRGTRRSRGRRLHAAGGGGAARFSTRSGRTRRRTGTPIRPRAALTSVSTPQGISAP